MNIYLANLIAALTRLPGIGRQTAERIGLMLVQDKYDTVRILTETLKNIDNIECCKLCGNITDKKINPCSICRDSKRNNDVLCVVESPGDIIKIESLGCFNDQYHSLMGKISPMTGIGVNDLNISVLYERLSSNDYNEVFFALGTDVESEATVSFLREYLNKFNIKFSRIAFDLPSGNSIEYLNSDILKNSIKNRYLLD